jgi:hypothetical protein
MNICEPTQIYAGKREAMTAEIGTPHYYDGAWLVQPTGAATWDAEGFDTIEESRREVEYLHSIWPRAQICWV